MEAHQRGITRTTSLSFNTTRDQGNKNNAVKVKKIIEKSRSSYQQEKRKRGGYIANKPFKSKIKVIVEQVF